MKLLQINAVYGQGSTGTIVKEIDELAQREGIDSYVVYSEASVSPRQGYCMGNIIDKKMHAVLSRICGKQAYYSKYETKKLLRYIGDIKPDVVHLHNLHSNYINLNMLLDYLATKEIRVILTQHDCWFYTGKCFHYTAKKCYQWKTGCIDCPKKYEDTPAYLFRATRDVWNDRKHFFAAIENLTVVSVSNWLTNETKKSILGNKHLITIHNGIDTNIFKPIVTNLREQWGMKNQFIVLGMANKWLSEVNSAVFNKLIEELDSNIRIVLVGCTTNQIRRLKNTRIKALGYVRDKKELAEVYSTVDVFVNLSWEDSFALVNLEALACGTPILAYGSTGVAEMIDSSTGILVEPGNVKQILQSVYRIKKLGKEEYSIKCREYALSHYDKISCFKEYINLYKDGVRRN